MGRKKFIIKNDQLDEVRYYFYEKSQKEFLSKKEMQLDEILKHKRVKNFTEEDKRLFNECRYERNEKERLDQALEKIISKQKNEKLTELEQKIFDQYNMYTHEDRDIYLQMQKNLRVFLKNLPKEVESEITKNQESTYKNREDKEKIKKNKQENFEKYNLGGCLKAFYATLNSEHKNEFELLLDMIKVFLIHEFLFKNHKDLKLMFDQWELSDTFDKYKLLINEMSNDPRNAFK